MAAAMFYFARMMGLGKVVVAAAAGALMVELAGIFIDRDGVIAAVEALHQGAAVRCGRPSRQAAADGGRAILDLCGREPRR